jgi:hypothetical protein
VEAIDAFPANGQPDRSAGVVTTLRLHTQQTMNPQGGSPPQEQQTTRPTSAEMVALQRQFYEMNVRLNQLEEEKVAWQSERSVLQQRIQERRSPPQPSILSIPTPTSTQAPPSPAIRPRARHPDVEKYDGEHSLGFRRFKAAMQIKMQVDGAVVGDSEQEQIYYAFGRLTGRASDRMIAWFEKNQGDPRSFTMNNFFNRLERSFADPDASSKARAKLSSCHQSTKPFATWIHKLSGLLTESGADEWHDEAKIDLLERLMDPDLLKAMVSVDNAPKDYDSYVDTLARVSNRLERANRTSRNTQKQTQQPSTSLRVVQPESMDWQPTTSTNQVGKRKAKWATKEERELRRKARLCLRCGNKHFIRNCPLDPPDRPTQVNQVVLQERFLSEEEPQKELDRDSESGKD